MTHTTNPHLVLIFVRSLGLETSEPKHTKNMDNLTGSLPMMMGGGLYLYLYLYKFKTTCLPEHTIP